MLHNHHVSEKNTSSDEQTLLKNVQAMVLGQADLVKGQKSKVLQIRVSNPKLSIHPSMQKLIQSKEQALDFEWDLHLFPVIYIKGFVHEDLLVTSVKENQG